MCSVHFSCFDLMHLSDKFYLFIKDSKCYITDSSLTKVDRQFGKEKVDR